jgi:hypothetical protein
MREASNEKDLKRLLQNVQMQLDAIKRGYMTFRDSQLELVKQYPEMIKEELKKYRQSVLKFFNIEVKKNLKNSLNMSNVDEENISINNVDIENSILSTDTNREVLITERGNKYYVKLNNQSQQIQQQQSLVNLNETIVSSDRPNQTDDTNSDVLPIDDLMLSSNNNNGIRALNDIDNKAYLRHTFIQFDLYKLIKNK